MARPPVNEPAPEPEATPGGFARRSRHTLVQSFRWAWDGLGGAAVRERNMRIHLALGLLASAASALLPLNGGERALLLLAVALVVAGEAANSALEAVVDLVSPAWNPRARVAKDAAAGAVLALAGGSAVVLLAVAVPAVPALREHWPALAPGVAGAVAASLATGFLPSPGRRPAAIDVALFAVGAAGIGAVARSAQAVAGVAAAGLLLALAGGAAVRRRRGVDGEG